MPTTHTLTITRMPDDSVNVSPLLPLGTVVQHQDTVKWNVINADTWKLSIAFTGGASLSSAVSDELIVGTSKDVSRGMVSPKAPSPPPGTYTDPYTVTLKSTGGIVRTGSSSLVIERNVSPPDTDPWPSENRPKGGSFHRSGAGSQDRHREEQRLGA